MMSLYVKNTNSFVGHITSYMAVRSFAIGDIDYDVKLDDKHMIDVPITIQTFILKALRGEAHKGEISEICNLIDDYLYYMESLYESVSFGFYKARYVQINYLAREGGRIAKQSKMIANRIQNVSETTEVSV